MNRDIRSRLYQDERIRNLVERKQRYVFILSALVLGIHFSFVFVLAFAPSWLSARLTEDGITTHGMLIAFLLVLAVFSIMFLFVRRKIAENNADIRELVNRISNE